VAFAAFYLLDDPQLWFHRVELNGGQPTWTQFVQLVNDRFGPSLTDNPIRELAMLRRTGNVNKYSAFHHALLLRHQLVRSPTNPIFHHGPRRSTAHRRHALAAVIPR
jgi:hypothetical protein